MTLPMPATLASRGARALLAATIGFGMLVACSGEPESGPVDVHWDRDTCERCSMVISDRAAAAQVRLPGIRTRKFDDLGCALLWLDAALPDATAKEVQRPEIWVSAGNGGWRDAWTTPYLPDNKTPMGYGYLPAAADSTEGIELSAVRERLRQAEGGRRNRGR